MAWTVPMTAVAGSVLTAAQMNTYVRDNLSETMPAKAGLPSSYFVTAGWGEIVARRANAWTDDTTLAISATSFDDPAEGRPGPELTIETGVTALVGFRAVVKVPSATARIEVGYEVLGATQREASRSRSIGYSASGNAAGMWLRTGTVDLCTGLTPGMNTFKLLYNVSSGTGSVEYRRLWVLPL
jgi:hypothetical protein